MAVMQTTTLTLSPCCPVDHAVTDPDSVTFLMPRGTEPHVWTARRRANSAFVGWFCLFPEGEGVAEIGYRLRRVDWGQGLASEGASALASWGFGAVGYERIIACTMAVNLGSRRVMERIGMRHVRTVPHNGTPLPGSVEGEVWYEVTRREWDAGRVAGQPGA